MLSCKYYYFVNDTATTEIYTLSLHDALPILLARALPETPAAEREALTRIADGSPGQALALAEGEGLALQVLVEEVLAALPRLDSRRAHGIADQVAGRRDAAAALAVFVALLRRALAAALRQAGRGGI